MKRICYLNNLLSWRLSLFIAILFTALALSAQQSCYEQYLRAHNMPLPTDSMTVDDSYDELKKEVIARQLIREESRLATQPIHQPIFLAIDTLAGTCHLLAEDGTILADVHLAMVDSTWYMWLSVDPLADKYPGNTPYLYCNGNPIMFIDPDGRQITIYGEDGTSYVYKSGETYDGTDKFINNAVFMLNEMRKADAVLLGPAIDEIANATLDTYDLQIRQRGTGIVDAKKSEHAAHWKQDPDGKYYCKKSTIYIPYMESTTNAEVKIAGEKEPLVAVFAHEFGHAFDAFCGNHFLYDKTKAQKEDGYDRWVGNKHEAMAIIFENIMRAIYNVNGRTEYYGKSTYKQ